MRGSFLQKSHEYWQKSPTCMTKEALYVTRLIHLHFGVQQLVPFKGLLSYCLDLFWRKQHNMPPRGSQVRNWQTLSRFSFSVFCIPFDTIYMTFRLEPPDMQEVVPLNPLYRPLKYESFSHLFDTINTTCRLEALRYARSSLF